jgi:outer membrane protein
MSRTRLALLAALTLAASPASAGPNPAGGEGPLTLDQAIATAVAHQPQLQAARAQVRAARARVDLATSPMLPQIGATAAYARTGGSATLGTVNTLSAGLSGSQLLFDFGQTWFGRQSASASARAQEESEKDSLQAVIFDVRSAWFTAAAARDLVAVGEETLANRDAHLKQVQGFVEVGARPEIDLAQARSDRASSLVQLINARNNLATSLAELARSMGVTGSTDYQLAATTVPAVPGEDDPEEQLFAEALSHRPDLASLAQQRLAQEASIRSLKATYAPSIAATGRTTYAGQRIGDLKDAWQLGVGLTWPLFEGGRTRAQISEANANLDVLDAQTESARQQLRLDVERAQLAVGAARAALEATGEAVLNARERLRLAEGRYQAGLGSGVELNDAQVAVTTASAQEVQARFVLASARAQLVRALGRG